MKESKATKGALKMSTLSFDYYYGQESEQFIFYRIPKLLFTDDRFSELSLEAKVLYGIMLDRMGLSIKNKWFDEQKRVYIVFTIDKIMNFLHCREQKANKILKDLEEIGLIERKRNGLGKPNFIYVKNFLGFHKNENDGAKKAEEIEQKMQKSDDFSAQKPPNEENLWQSQHQNNEKDNSRNAISATQDFSKSQSINTPLINDTDFSDTGFHDTKKTNETVCINNKQDTLSYLSYPSNIDKQLEQQKTDRIDEIEHISCFTTEKKEKPKPKQQFFIDKGLEEQMCRATIQKNIEYRFLAENKSTRYYIQLINNMVDIMVSVITSHKKTIRIGGEEIPQQMVKERLLKLNSRHIEYVLECLNKTKNKIHNIRAYYLSALYNATETMDAYYQAEVNYEMYG